ncbi:MAG: hypothetical protein IPG24_13960 [Leptospiraceae bacterium]|nr:hypothetical protein [Leptospiraceae bacterium]
MCFAINCEVVNFDSKKEKERCKLTLVYRINVTKKNWNDPDYPLYLYLFSSEYKIVYNLPKNYHFQSFKSSG